MISFGCLHCLLQFFYFSRFQSFFEKLNHKRRPVLGELWNILNILFIEIYKNKLPWPALPISRKYIPILSRWCMDPLRNVPNVYVDTFLWWSMIKKKKQKQIHMQLPHVLRCVHSICKMPRLKQKIHTWPPIHAHMNPESCDTFSTSFPDVGALYHGPWKNTQSTVLFPQT